MRETWGRKTEREEGGGGKRGREREGNGGEVEGER